MQDPLLQEITQKYLSLTNSFIMYYHYVNADISFLVIVHMIKVVMNP